MDLIHKYSRELEKILNHSPFDLKNSLKKICVLLQSNILHFDWVGFYFNNDKKNYLSCNINVKSEIVIPLFVDNKNIGQIDVDSNSINPFTESDVKFLEFVCEKLAMKIKTLKNEHG